MRKSSKPASFGRKSVPSLTLQNQGIEKCKYSIQGLVALFRSNLRNVLSCQSLEFRTAKPHTYTNRLTYKLPFWVLKTSDLLHFLCLRNQTKMLGTVTHVSTMGGWGRKIAVTPRPVWAMYWVTDRSRLQNETMPQKIKMNNLCQIESKSWLLVKRCLLLSSLSNAWEQNNVGELLGPE